MKPQEIIALIKQEVKPALGCTEPIAEALAVAKAAEIISENCPCCTDWRLKADFRLDVAVSGNILKNGMGVGIPGTGMVGLPVAAALGAVCGDSSLGLEVLSGLTPEAVQRAKELVSKGCVHISVADTEHLLYVKALRLRNTMNSLRKLVVKGLKASTSENLCLLMSCWIECMKKECSGKNNSHCIF